LPENHKAKAQKVLVALWNEQLIPFELTVGKLTKSGEEYTIHFHDSRIRTAKILVPNDRHFADLVRAAVLDRVGRMSGPLHAVHAVRERA
jgi:hypothetical protein